MKIKVALIGFGLSGAVFHAPLLKALPSQYEITVVLSSDSQKVIKDIGEVEVVQSYKSVLENSKIELVIITSPNHLHYEMAKQALLHNKHVVVEKPMVIETWEAKELIGIAKERGLMLSVYQNRRWDNDFLTIKKLINENRLGEINIYEARFDRFIPQVRDKWKERAGRGCGVLYDLGSHLIDQALHLFGTPQFIQADVTSQRAYATTDDFFHILMGYEQLRVILQAGCIVLGAGPKYMVHGSKGSYIKYGIDCQESALRAGEQLTSEHWGQDDPDCYGQLTLVEDNRTVVQRVKTTPGAYLTFYKDVYSHIRQGAPAPVSGEEGLRTIQVIQAALQSNAEKRRVCWEEIII